MILIYFASPVLNCSPLFLVNAWIPLTFEDHLCNLFSVLGMLWVWIHHNTCFFFFGDHFCAFLLVPPKSLPSASMECGETWQLSFYIYAHALFFFFMLIFSCQVSVTSYWSSGLRRSWENSGPIMLFISVNSTCFGHGCRLKMGIHNQSNQEISTLLQKIRKWASLLWRSQSLRYLNGNEKLLEDLMLAAQEWWPVGPLNTNNINLCDGNENTTMQIGPTSSILSYAFRFGC